MGGRRWLAESGGAALAERLLQTTCRSGWVFEALCNRLAQAGHATELTFSGVGG